MASKVIIPAAAPAWVQPYTQSLTKSLGPGSTPDGPTKMDIEDGTITLGKYVLFPNASIQNPALAAKNPLPDIEVDTLDEVAACENYSLMGILATYTHSLRNPSNHVGSSIALRFSVSPTETRTDDRFALLESVLLIYSDGTTWRRMDGAQLLPSGTTTFVNFDFLAQTQA
jgi:hypothetical protein